MWIRYILSSGKNDDVILATSLFVFVVEGRQSNSNAAVANLHAEVHAETEAIEHDYKLRQKN